MSGTPAWLARFPVSRGGSWAAHRARGSLGGVDWAAPAGTRIKSPSAGVVSYRVMRDGSSVAKVKRDDGTATEFLHGRPLGGPRRVELDEDIAISDGRPGTPGAGPSDGAHIHAHDLTAAGVRVPPFSTIREAPRRKARAVKVIKRVGAGAPEWSLISPDLVGESDLERGYLVTADPERALIWERDWANGGGTADTLGAAPGKSNRAAYIAHQAEARELHAAYLRGLPTGESVAVELGDAALSDADVARIARAVRAEIIAEPGE